MNFAKFVRTPFVTEHFWCLLLVSIIVNVLRMVTLTKLVSLFQQILPLHIFLRIRPSPQNLVTTMSRNQNPDAAGNISLISFLFLHGDPEFTTYLLKNPFINDYVDITWMKLTHFVPATGLFRYPLKKSENQRFSDVFRGYRKRPVSWNGLKGK